MKSPQRYNAYELVERKEGELVFWEDYEALEQQYKNALWAHAAEIKKLLDQIEELKQP